MLSLIEAPGKRGPGDRSERHLLAGGGVAEEEDFYESTQLVHTERLSLRQRLSLWLVGSSNSLHCTERWKRDFSQRPSWCDADMALQQIRRGKARGNRIALYARAVVQKALFGLGSTVQRQSLTVLLTVLIAFTLCCYGLQYVRIETDIVKLWVSQGGSLHEELNFLTEIQGESNISVHNEEAVRENGIGGGYQVIIQTQSSPEEVMLSRDGLLKHVHLMQQIAEYSIDLYGRNWTLQDICFKPPGPEMANDSMANSFSSVIERIIPCIWITPIDCFWEGSKPLGPNPPLPLSSLGALQWLTSIPSSRPLSWKNLNPAAVLQEISELYDIGTVQNFFQRTGIGSGYVERSCIDPLDVECPSSAPNFYDICPVLSPFRKWNASLPVGEKIELEMAMLSEGESGGDGFSLFGLVGKRRKRTVNHESSLTEHRPTPSKAKNPSSHDDDEETASNATDCLLYGDGLRRWMNANRDKWELFLSKEQYPRYPDFAAELSDGCRGFAKSVMSWPEELIIGGSRREEKKLQKAEAFQSIFLVASEKDVFLRHKNAKFVNSPWNSSDWNVESAASVIRTWQRNFTRLIYEHPWNKEGATRVVHPLASTSIADMLDEFCQFNYDVILIGYALMLVYAIYSQLHREGWRTAVHSSTGLGLVGVLTVTFASVAGLGLATWFGIDFNAATTQIVPFLSLGIGVDNMFLLLHNYNRIVKEALPGQEIGILMKETGMSVLITSINNILSFLAGTILPIPALRSFCAQSSILLTFNLIAIMTVYPALMSIDLRRRRSGRRDICCCSRVPLEHDFDEEFVRKVPVQEKRIIGEMPSYRGLVSGYNERDDDEEDDVLSWTLHAFLRNYYIPLLKSNTIKVVVLVVCAVMLLSGVIGMRQAPIGLELSDVLPVNSAPSDFLKARDRYFSFYPMTAVLKGPLIDYPGMQHKIDDFRLTIAKSRFVVRGDNGEPTEKYWLGLMRGWLNTLQKDLDAAMMRGAFDLVTGDVIAKNVSDEALLARRLVCSVGMKFNCTQRLDRVRLVDASGTINGDGFYNCLTAWCNEDGMMYYVSQAAFFPAPPIWKFAKNEDGLVPPMAPPAYSQIPFYLTGLTDTPIIVDMIKDIRSICRRFSSEGLPNFPGGVAFTFWDQYLHLETTLLHAIGVILLAVFCVISLLLFNPWAAGLIVTVLIIMTVELAGFLGLAGVKLNPISAVTLITAVGIGVEFTAHVVLAFLTALGSRNERMAHCIDRVFVPVIHGALSTLLGIIMLAFSEFEFVVKYFFVVMSALIVIGLVNGLALLPVLLSLIGPPCEVTPVDGSDRLPPPPPRTHRKTWSQEMHVSSCSEFKKQTGDGGLSLSRHGPSTNS